MKEAVITSSILIMCVVLLRKLCRKRISAKLQYMLWLVVAARLIMPGITMLWPDLLPESNYSVLNATDRLERAVQDYMKPPEQPVQGSLPSEGLPFLTGENADGEVVTYLPEQSIWPELMKKAWYLGIFIVGAWMVYVNIRFMRNLHGSRRRYEKEDFKLPVYTVKELSSPCLYGRPGRQAVYLPEDATGDEDKMRHILAHEYCHYKQKDLWWSILRCVLLAVYWFHPLVWLAAVLSKQDCELSCDEAAVRLLGEEERIAYGKTLVSLITRKTKAADIVCTVTTMTEDPKGIKERIQRIAESPHRLAFVFIPVFAVVAVAAILTFTQARDSGEGIYLSEEESSRTVTTSCFQVTFPETFAGRAYYQGENGTDIIVYHKDSGLEIGRFCMLFYEEAARLTLEEGKEAVLIGNYGANASLNGYLERDQEAVENTDHEYMIEDGNNTAGVPGTDSNETMTYYSPGVEKADETAAWEASGEMEPIPAPELVKTEVIDLPFQENEDYNTIIVEDETEYLIMDENADETEYLIMDENADETEYLIVDENAKEEENRSYSERDGIQAAEESTVYLPDEQITEIYIPAEQPCYLYIPADYSEADPEVREELSEMNQALKELADSVIVLYVSREAMEEALNTVVVNRTAYVGDNVRVSNIAASLPAASGLSYQFLELKTTTEPYEVTLHYRLQEDNAVQTDSGISFLEAVLMFAAIENLETCNMRIYDLRERNDGMHSDPSDQQSEVFSYERKEMEAIFGPLYPCSETKETVTELYNRVLEYLDDEI